MTSASDPSPKAATEPHQGDADSADIQSVAHPQEPAAPSRSLLLSVTGVGKCFVDGGRTRWVLDNVDCAIDAGSAVAVWGPSGCGKSTLLRLIAGMAVPDAGAIRFHPCNEPPFEMSSASERRRIAFRRRRIGFIFQFFNLVPTLTVAENVLLPLWLNGLMAQRDAALARLDALGVGACRERFPDTLSGGEQQRVAIARALAHAPALVLADEPTGNLDGQNAATVVDLLWQSAADAGSALVIATHNERIGDRADATIELA